MPKYIVNVSRTAYRNKDIEVTAKNSLEAERKALAMAGGEEFPAEHGADYAVESCQKED